MGYLVTTWHVWTDGSCHHGGSAPKGVGGWGGWAAIVEHGSDGVVLRGRVPDTTNVRMELLAAIEGLRAIPDGERVILHTDATTILGAVRCWRAGGLRREEGPHADHDLWRQLGLETSRVGVELRLLGRGERDPVHKRAHVLAGAEARGGLRDLPANVTPLDIEDVRLIRKGMRRVARHLADCSTGLCVYACPTGGAATRVQARRRASAARTP